MQDKKFSQPESDGSRSVVRQAVRKSENGTYRVEKRGEIKLLPQPTADGAPAQVTEGMEGRLLNLSQSIDATVDVSSGVRSQEQQDALIASGNQRAATVSQHTVGDAADISVSGMTKREVAAAAFATGEFERVNIYKDSGEVHVDQHDVGPGTQLYENWYRMPPP